MSVFDVKLVLLGCSSCGRRAWWAAEDALGSRRCAAPRSHVPIWSFSIHRQEHAAVPPGAWALPPGPAAHLWSRVWSQAGAWHAVVRLQFFRTGAGSRSPDAAMACNLLGQLLLPWVCPLAAVFASCPTSMQAGPRVDKPCLCPSPPPNAGRGGPAWSARQRCQRQRARGAQQRDWRACQQRG